MTGGFPNYPQSRFPNDLPPTIFSPASPKVKATKSEKDEKDLETESIASQATFSSTVSLIKSSIKSKLPSNKKARKDAGAQLDSVPEKTSSKRKPLPKDPKTPRQRTTEAYIYFAQMK